MAPGGEINWYRGLGIVTVVVAELVVSVSLLLGVSLWLSNKYRLPNWVPLIAGLAGFGLGGYRVVVYLKKIEKNENL